MTAARPRRRKLAGAIPNMRLQARVKAAWLSKPALMAIADGIRTFYEPAACKKQPSLLSIILDGFSSQTPKDPVEVEA